MGKNGTIFKYNSLIPLLLLLSIVLLLPLPWYKDMYGNPMTFEIEDLSGFRVFSFRYPVIYSYILSLVSLLISSKKGIVTYLTISLISIFCSFLVIFPVFLGGHTFSKLVLTSLSVTVFLVISISVLAGVLIIREKESLK